MKEEERDGIIQILIESMKETELHNKLEEESSDSLPPSLPLSPPTRIPMEPHDLLPHATRHK